MKGAFPALTWDLFQIVCLTCAICCSMVLRNKFVPLMPVLASKSDQSLGQAVVKQIRKNCKITDKDVF